MTGSIIGSFLQSGRAYVKMPADDTFALRRSCQASPVNAGASLSICSRMTVLQPLPLVRTGVEIVCGLICLSARVLLPDALFQAVGSALAGFGVLEIIIILMTARARKAANRAG